MSEYTADLIPISMLNALAYCPRRFGYEHLQAEMVVNEFVAEGRILHSSVDGGHRTWIDGGIQERSLYVWSRRLGIAGIIDLLQQADGQIWPIEYKRGRPGRWRNDYVQLCAQALCLEELFDQPVDTGYLFSWASRRRETVLFDPELRRWTADVIAEAHRICAAGRLPPPLVEQSRCRDCSLQPICLPAETRLLMLGGPEDAQD